MTATNTAPNTASMRHLMIMYSSSPSHRSSTVTVIYRLHRFLPLCRRCRCSACRSARVRYFPGQPHRSSFFFTGCSFPSFLLDTYSDKILLPFHIFHILEFLRFSFKYLGICHHNTPLFLECQCSFCRYIPSFLNFLLYNRQNL